MVLEILSQEESEQLINYYFSQAASFTYGVLTNGNNNARAFAPAFMFKNSRDLIVNLDGSVTWKAREIGLGFHSFIELITGERTKRKVYIPLCLVNPRSRKFLKLLLETTKAPEDDRYNSQPAQFYVLAADGRGFRVEVKLLNLAAHYVMLQLMPPEFVFRYRSKHCPFCRKLREVE